MSNESLTKNADSKRILRPTLRFLEFAETGPWLTKRLEDVAPLQRGFDLPSDQIKPGNVPVVYSNGVQSFHSIGMARGPGLVTGRSGTIGRLHYIESGEYWPHNTSLWVTSFNGNFPKFVYYLFESIGMNRFASGSGVPTLNRNDVHEFYASVPPTLAEQQKISDCLTSLNDLTVAHARALEALRLHKKGLLQQLFPRKGEVLPQLRFGEFCDGPAWELRTLSAIAENLDNMRVPVAEISREKGDIPYYGASGIVDHVKDYLFDEDLLCVSEDGANLVARTYPIAFSISGKTWVNNHAHVLRFEDHATQKIVEHYLNSIDLRDFITGMAQPKLNRTMLDNIPVPLPRIPEREQVAGFLSSLESLIAAQARKVDRLATHKKGLMQQLFPSQEQSL